MAKASTASTDDAYRLGAIRRTARFIGKDEGGNALRKPRVFIDHIDQRVRSASEATPFYDALMTALGMRRITGDQDDWVGYAYEEQDGDGPTPTPFFGLNPSPDHRPGETRIAFWAETRSDVDRIADAVRLAGARSVEGPELCEEYGPTYYAVFFEDPGGNRFEVCCRHQDG